MSNMKVAIFGATGFIGKILSQTMTAKGWSVVALDIRRDSLWKDKVKEVDAVVNLAGHPLFKDRWTSRIKGLIHDSRVDGTKTIVEAIQGSKVKVLVNASAIGIYGESEVDKDESSKPGDDFLARVCESWEAEAIVAERAHKIRTVLLRTGIVLGKEGGALEKLLTPFKLGLGGTLGLKGEQSMSWVHIDDVVGIIIHAIENEKLHGPVNATAPNIVSNKTFTQALGKVLHRPTLFPVPKLALYLVVGEAAGVIASGQRAHPKATLASGYTFKFPDLEPALKNILG